MKVIGSHGSWLSCRGELQCSWEVDGANPQERRPFLGNDSGYAHNLPCVHLQIRVFSILSCFQGCNTIFLYCQLVLSRVRTLINGLFLIGNWCFFTTINGVTTPK